MGRATLIKSVALSTPLYTMSSFKLPKKICQDLDAVVWKFWWNPRKEGNCYHTPLAWNELCRPQSHGGLGFRSFESFNEAMIAKLVWWVLSSQDSFCVKVLRAKYKVGNKWLHSVPTKSASFSWRGIESARVLISKGGCKLVGNGNNILVWDEPWVPELPNFCSQPRVADNSPCMAVSQRMTPDKSGCDISKLLLYFDSDTVQAIQNIPRWGSNQEDRWIWLKTGNGELTVKSAYKEIYNGDEGSQVCQIMGQIWKTIIHARLQMLLWRVASGILPTMDLLAQFASEGDMQCVVCGHEMESTIHVLWDCSLARAIWFGCIWSLRADRFQITSPKELVEAIIYPPNELELGDDLKEKFILLGALIVDQLW